MIYLKGGGHSPQQGGVGFRSGAQASWGVWWAKGLGKLVTYATKARSFSLFRLSSYPLSYSRESLPHEALLILSPVLGVGICFSGTPRGARYR